VAGLKLAFFLPLLGLLVCNTTPYFKKILFNTLLLKSNGTDGSMRDYQEATAEIKERTNLRH
jgi:hypothetical protein